MEKIQIPCVACKSRKIKCSTECPLAPIFTPDRSEDFEAVARVFSAHKFIKLIKEAEPHQQVLAGDSLINEAKARIADPVCGLTGTVYKLSCQLEDLRSELVLTKQENEVHYKQVGTSSSALGASRLLQQLDRLGTNPLLPMPSNERSCGACRYKKQKCLPQCPFAPFFPPNKKEDFQNIVKVYGGANFMKLVNLAEPHKHLAADSMIFEANARISDPVNGLAGIVDTLSQQLDDLTSELSAVRFHAKRTIVQEQKSRKKIHSRSTSAMEASSPAPVTLPFDTKNGGLSSNLSTAQVDVKPTVSLLSIYTNQVKDMDPTDSVVNSKNCSSGAIVKCSKNDDDLTKSSFLDNKEIAPLVKKRTKVFVKSNVAVSGTIKV